MCIRVLQCCVLAYLILSSSGSQQKNKTSPKYKKPFVRQDEENLSGPKNNDDSFGGNEGDGGEFEDGGQANEDNVNEKPNAYDEGSIQAGDLLDEEEAEEAPDMQIPPERELLDRNSPEPGFYLSHAEMMKFKLWSNAFIPYYIDVHSFSDKVLRDKIRSFLSSVNSLTTLNFVELPSPPYDNSRWVLFMNRRGLLGCADHSVRNFTNSGVQYVILGYHCMSTEGELSEAVLSIAGVPAQHNAPDRDYYIQVNEGNIMPEKRYLFDKLSDNDWLFHDLEYDFHSASHFQSYRHSLNGRATIEPTTDKANDIVLGQAKELSPLDIKKIRMLYNYMVKKRLLQAPDCHKLFEPGKKFNEYTPSEVYLNPRDKPYRYTGENADAPLEGPEDQQQYVYIDDTVMPEHEYMNDYHKKQPQFGENNDPDIELVPKAVGNDNAIKTKTINIHDNDDIPGHEYMNYYHKTQQKFGEGSKTDVELVPKVVGNDNAIKPIDEIVLPGHEYMNDYHKKQPQFGENNDPDIEVVPKVVGNDNAKKTKTINIHGNDDIVLPGHEYMNDYHKTQQEFGEGSKTDVELVPEVVGNYNAIKPIDDIVLPGHEYMNDYHKKRQEIGKDNNPNIELVPDVVGNENAIKSKTINIHSRNVQALKPPLKKKMLSEDLVSYLSDYLSYDEWRKTYNKKNTDAKLKWGKIGAIKQKKG